MAQVHRLKLQARYCPRLFPSPPLASKLLDPRHVPWRCYGENALLEESCNSTLNANDIDRYSKAANGGGDLTRKGEDKASKESYMDKLTTSICDKLWARASVVSGEKGKGIQRQQEPLLIKESKKDEKDDQWQQVVSSVRTMLLKNKAKAAAGDKLGVPKTEANEDQCDFSDLDLPEAGGKFGVSRGPNASNKDSLVMSAFGKSLKQKTSQLQFSHKQKSKDTKPLSSLESDDTVLSSILLPDDNTSATQTEISKNKTARLLTETDFSSALKPSNLHDKNQLRNNNAMPGSVDSKMSKGKDSVVPRAAEDRSSAQVWSQSSCKDTTQFKSNFKAEGSGNAPPAQLRGKFISYATPSSNGNSVPNKGYMICVLNLHSSYNPAMIKASMAVHGEVLGFFKKAVRNDYFNVYIQFKTVQSMKGALAARKLQIGNKYFLIARTDQVFSTVVRLRQVHKDTTEKNVFSICGKYGSIDHVRRRSNGMFDVFYEVKELPNMTRILGSLNEVTHIGSTWIAAPAPTLHPSVQKEALNSPEGQAWHEIQVNQALNRIETGLDGVCVLFEDLKELTALGKEFSK